MRDNLSAYDNDETATPAVSVGPSPTHKIWATESGFTFRCCPTSGRTARWRRPTGVQPGAGFANRGTFVIDRAGVIRFAECKEPGEARDQKVWTDALASLKA